MSDVSKTILSLGYYKASSIVDRNSVDFYFNLLPAVSGEMLLDVPESGPCIFDIDNDFIV